jgi:hypothetical protein
MERRLGNDQTMILNPFTLIGPASRLLVAALTALVAAAPASAQYYGERTFRYGNTSGVFFDGRGDNRDFPTDGVFPGNFAANPFYAQNGGAAGFLESNPRRSATSYPSQVYFARDRIDCRGYRFRTASKNQNCRHGP